MNKFFVALVLIISLLCISFAPVVAYADDVAVASDYEVEPCSDGFEWHYKYDENGRRMRRLWSFAKEMYVTDWEYY